MIEAMRKAILEKESLISNMAEQMAEKTESGDITPGTLRCFKQARQNFQSLKLAEENHNHEKVVYFYGRLCSGLGEVIGRCSK